MAIDNSSERSYICAIEEIYMQKLIWLLILAVLTLVIYAAPTAQADGISVEDGT